MSELIINTAVTTITALAVILIFVVATIKVWWWLFQVDELIFWISRMVLKFDKKNTLNVTNKDQWKKMYEQLMSDDRNN